MTSRTRTYIYLAGLFWSVLIFSGPLVAHAGLIFQAPTYIGLNKGLVGYWSFDGPTIAGTDLINAYDLSGNGNTASSTGKLIPQRAIGKIGQAMKFDDVNDYFSVADAASLDPINGDGNWSISAWAKLADTNQIGPIIQKFISAQEWKLLICSALSCGGGAGQQLLGTFIDAAGNSRQSLSDADVLDGNWHHFVYVADKAADKVRLFKDGLELSTSLSNVGSWPSVDTSGGGATSIGGDLNPESLNGTLDEVRVYNRKLSLDEIKRLYKIGGTLKFNASRADTLTNGLVGMWTFDAPDMARDSSGNLTAFDRSGNGNTADTQSSTVFPNPHIGKLGQALEFTAPSSKIGVNNVAHTGLNNLSAVSVSFWVYPKTLGTFRALIAKAFSLSSGEGWELSTDGSDQTSLYFFVDYNGATDLIATQNDGSPQVPLVTNEWRHIVVTWDGTASAANVRFYVNASSTTFKVTSDGAGARVDDSTHDFKIGNEANNNSGFDGYIDDVRLYNRVISPAEVKRLFNMGGTFKINASRTDTLTKGLVGYWTFDGPDISLDDSGVITAYDRSGQGNDVNQNTPSEIPKKTIGKIGQALNFDGVANHIVSPDKASLSPANISVSAWVYRNSSTNDVGIIGKRTDPTTDYAFRMEIDSTNNTVFGVTTDCTSGTDASTAGVTVGTWTHLVGTFDGSAIKLYVDGILKNTAAKSGNLCDSGEQLFIGTQQASTPTYWNGKIDEVRIYNRALSANEVKRLYNLGR